MTKTEPQAMNTFSPSLIPGKRPQPCSLQLNYAHTPHEEKNHFGPNTKLCPFFYPDTWAIKTQNKLFVQVPSMQWKQHYCFISSQSAVGAKPGDLRGHRGGRPKHSS